MARQVRWTETAAEDIRITAEFIERDSIAYASIWVRKVLESADTLREMADRGRKVPEWPDAGVREIFVMGHRIIYLVSRDAVHILAVVHGSRDLTRLKDRS